MLLPRSFVLPLFLWASRTVPNRLPTSNVDLVVSCSRDFASLLPRPPRAIQVGQLTWTIVTICMIVAQVKFVAHNIFNGIFWLFFPASLVICNDITAYFW